MSFGPKELASLETNVNFSIAKSLPSRQPQQVLKPIPRAKPKPRPKEKPRLRLKDNEPRQQLPPD